MATVKLVKSTSLFFVEPNWLNPVILSKQIGTGGHLFKTTIFGIILLLFMVPLSAVANTLLYFGYAAINCGHDDPHDAHDISDYTAEVAAFTNLNQVCIDASVAVTADRLRNSAKYSTPLFYIEPALFEERRGRMRLRPDAVQYLSLISQSIEASGIPESKLIFYLADEPALRKLPEEELEAAAGLLQDSFPNTPIMVIEAYHAGGPPSIAPNIQYWGFNTYALPDPALEPRYGAYLDIAANKLGPHQSLVMVLDAQYTPVHKSAGLSEADMADVAKAYHAYALKRGDITALLGYTWAGGIDGLYEIGVRDMVEAVQNAHREIGRAITGK